MDLYSSKEFNKALSKKKVIADHLNGLNVAIASFPAEIRELFCFMPTVLLNTLEQLDFHRQSMMRLIMRETLSTQGGVNYEISLPIPWVMVDEDHPDGIECAVSMALDSDNEDLVSMLIALPDGKIIEPISIEFASLMKTLEMVCAEILTRISGEMADLPIDTALKGNSTYH